MHKTRTWKPLKHGNEELQAPGPMSNQQHDANQVEYSHKDPERTQKLHSIIFVIFSRFSQVVVQRGGGGCGNEHLTRSQCSCVQESSSSSSSGCGQNVVSDHVGPWPVVVSGFFGCDVVVVALGEEGQRKMVISH